MTTGLPTSLPTLVLLGSVIRAVVPWFFDTRGFGMHPSMTILLSGLLGLTTFLVDTPDDPFRGRVSIGPDAPETVYSQLMTK